MSLEASKTTLSMQLRLPDTPERRAWIRGWCQGMVWPVHGDTLSAVGWPEEMGRSAPAALNASLRWKSEPEKPRDVAHRVALGPEHFSRPRPGRTIIIDGWIMRLEGDVPASVAWSAVDSWFVADLSFSVPASASGWVNMAIIEHLRIARFLEPEAQMEVGGVDVPETAEGPPGSKPHRELYKLVCEWAFREVGTFCTENAVAPRSERAELRQRWLCDALRRLIAEEDRLGYVPRDIIRSKAVQLLEALQLPPGKRHRLFDLWV